MELIGDLRVGWQIIEFNGVDITRATFRDMKKLLGTVGESMELKQMENEALRATYTKAPQGASSGDIASLA